ncbi:MAG: hypothetical protein RLZZ124_784 [Cyanobacteriota bacterium]|jgi:hypothetical protein
MPTSTLPEGQSLYDFLSQGKPNGKNVYETSSMPQRTEDLHRTIGYPQGQLNKLEIGSRTSDLTTAITGAEPANAAPVDAVILGQKASPAGKPDLVGPAKSTVVTAPAEFLAPAAGLPDLTPSSGSTLDQIFKSHKGKG